MIKLNLAIRCLHIVEQLDFMVFHQLLKTTRILNPINNVNNDHLSTNGSKANFKGAAGVMNTRVNLSNNVNFQK